MPYIGNTPAEKYAAFNVQYFTTSATTSYTLDRAVANELDIRLVINNVIQEPGAGKAYTAAGTTLTLTSATAGGDTMYAVYIGKAVQTVNPGANSVGPTALQDNSVTNAKLADATQGDIIYYAAAGAPAQLSAGTSGFFLKTQGAGANPIWAADNDTVSAVRPNVNPLIINGDMNVAQRATSVTGITDDGYKLCDRWYEYLSSLGTYTFAQEAQSINDPVGAAGFRQAFRIDCTTADASPSASDEFWWGMKFEGQDLQLIKKGSSNAEKLTLAFWVKSNKTGVGQVNFRDTDNGRMCSGTYTISVANTWEHKIINIAADTTGAFTDDNAESLQIQWYLDSGSNYEGGATPTAWEADSAGDRNASGTLNIGDNTANDWSITGIQLEVGEYTASTIPPFQFESFGDNLNRCCRYFFYTGGGSAYQSHGTGVEVSATAGYLNIPLPNILRSSPSITKEDSLVIWDGNSENAITSLGNIYYSARGSLVNVSVVASGGGLDDRAGIIVYSNADGSSGFLISAEL